MLMILLLLSLLPLLSESYSWVLNSPTDKFTNIYWHSLDYVFQEFHPTLNRHDPNPRSPEPQSERITDVGRGGGGGPIWGCAVYTGCRDGFI